MVKKNDKNNYFQYILVNLATHNKITQPEKSFATLIVIISIFISIRSQKEHLKIWKKCSRTKINNAYHFWPILPTLSSNRVN